VKTLNQIVAEVENWASSHLQVHSFGQGDIWEISPSSSQFTFPLMWVTVGQSDPREMEMVDQFNVLVCDLVDTGEKNELEVLSDTRQILRDLVAWYRQQHSAAYIVEFQGAITPFTERFAERVSGHALTIRLRQPYDYDSCAIPLGTPLPAPPFCEPATFTLINTATPPATLDSGSIPSGGSDVIVAPPVTVIAANSLNTQIGPTVTPPSGGSDVIPLPDVTHTQTYGNPETLPNGVALVCDPALPASWNLENTNGSPLGSGSIPSAGSDTIVAPDGTVEINGDSVTNVPSGGMVNIMVEQDGNPVGAFDPNSNSWVIPPCGDGGDVTVTVSDATPSTGDTITITATPTGFTANNYLFFTYDGLTITEIVEQSSGVYSWFVDRAGTYDIYAVATDGTVKSWGKVGIVAASVFILDQIPTQPIWAVSLRKLRSAYTGPAATVRRSSDNATHNIGFIGEDLDTAALTAFVGVGNGFTATLYDQIAGVNPFQTTAGNQPRMVLSGTIDLLGGKPTIVFNGSSHQMPMPSSVSCAHGFLVARKASNTNSAQYVLGGTSQGLAFGGTFTVNTANINVISPGGNLISTVNNTLPHQVSFRLGGSGAGRLRVDGVTEAIGTTSANMTINFLGTLPNANLRHVGDFSEAILYPSVLSDADELVIENNQRAYYGL